MTFGAPSKPCTAVACTAMARDKCVPGCSIRVWRHSATALRGELAQIIRWEAQMLRCETLCGVVFVFSPCDVAKGLDAEVTRYEVCPENAPRAALRKREAVRLASALDKEGRIVGSLDDFCSSDIDGFVMTPSQVRATATMLSKDVTPRQRLAWQASLEQDMEELAHLQIGAHPDRRSTAEGGDEAPHRHRPELCQDCIRKGGWCSGTWHLADAPKALATAAESLLSAGSFKRDHLRWRSSAAGLETEFVYKGEAVLLQLRPWLFCVSDAEAATSMAWPTMAAWEPLGCPPQQACTEPNIPSTPLGFIHLDNCQDEGSTAELDSLEQPEIAPKYTSGMLGTASTRAPSFDLSEVGDLADLQDYPWLDTFDIQDIQTAREDEEHTQLVAAKRIPSSVMCFSAMRFCVC